MEIQPGQPTNPPGHHFVRWGLRGGAVASLGPVVYALATNVSGAAMLAVLGFGALGGAGALVIGSLVFSRRRITLALVENELERARGMMERRLISEGEYLDLKSRILASYQSGPSPMLNLWLPAFWGAVLGMLASSGIVIASMDMLIEVGLVVAVVSVVGGSVIGAVAQAAALASGAARHQLAAPDNRRLLGE